MCSEKPCKEPPLFSQSLVPPMLCSDCVWCSGQSAKEQTSSSGVPGGAPARDLRGLLVKTKIIISTLRMTPTLRTPPLPIISILRMPPTLRTSPLPIISILRMPPTLRTPPFLHTLPLRGFPPGLGFELPPSCTPARPYATSLPTCADVWLPPHISLYLPVSPCISLDLPRSP